MYHGGTKDGEYYSALDVLETIRTSQSLYYLLAFLVDCQYTDTDIKRMVELLEKIAENKAKAFKNSKNDWL